MAKAVKTVVEQTKTAKASASAAKPKAPARKIYMAAKPGTISRARIRAAVRAMSQT